MNTINTIKQSIITIIVCVAVVAGVSLVYSWTGPTAAPPGGNVAAPINVSSVSQIKSGALQVNGFRNLGTTILDGNVGIGTTGPMYKLEVVGAGTSAGTLEPVAYFRKNSASQGGALISVNDTVIDYGSNANSGAGNFDLSFSSLVTGVQTERMRIQSNGNVGIGTTNPSQKLDVAGYVKGQSGLCIGSDCRTSWPAGGTGGLTGSGSTNYVSKWTGATSLGNSTIFESGDRVVVGGTSPYPGALDGAQMSIKSANFNRAALYWGVGDTLVGFLGVRDGNTALIGAAFSANDLIFRAGGNDRMIIRNDNSIGWYNTSNTQVGFLGFNGNDALVGAYSPTGGALRLRAQGGDRMIINSSGATVSGNVYANDYWIGASGKWASQLGGGGGNYLPLTGGTVTGNLNVDGQLKYQAGGTTIRMSNVLSNYYEFIQNESSAWGVSKWASSKRFKENITDLELDSSKIYDLRPVSFNWNSERGGQRDFGIIAEEAAEISPLLVVYDKEGKPFSFRYDVLSVLLLNELKKKATEINVLNETVEQLKTRIEKLEQGR